MRKILLEKIKNNFEIEYYSVLQNETKPKVVFKYYPLVGENIAVSILRDLNDYFFVLMHENNRINEYTVAKRFDKKLKSKIFNIVKNYTDFKSFEKEVLNFFRNEKIEIVDQKRVKTNYTVEEFEEDFKKLNYQEYYI